MASATTQRVLAEPLLTSARSSIIPGEGRVNNDGMMDVWRWEGSTPFCIWIGWLMAVQAAVLWSRHLSCMRCMAFSAAWVLASVQFDWPHRTQIKHAHFQFSASTYNYRQLLMHVMVCEQTRFYDTIEIHERIVSGLHERASASLNDCMIQLRST
jgi:hypothetical protein